MIYAQIIKGGKLHLAYEPGEGRDKRHLVEAGYLSKPLCGQNIVGRGYRMIINVPLNNACKKCQRTNKQRA